MPKILLVEDDLPLLRLYQTALQDRYEVYGAESCEAGLQAVISFEPDLVVLDMNLPDAPGTNILNALDEAGTTRAVIMTGFAQYKKETLPALVVDVLNKPVTPSMLLRVVEAALASSYHS
jgi:DNA-binding response OmpR family regulator